MSNQNTVTISLSMAEMELAGLNVEDVEVRAFHQCGCLIREYSRQVNGSEIRRWFSDGGCRNQPVEITKNAAYAVYGQRIAKANKTINHFAEEKAKGRTYGARSSGPLYKAEANLTYALKGLAAL